MGIVKEYSQTENCVSDNLQTKYDESIITETNNYGKKYLEEGWKQGDKICKRSKFLDLPYILKREKKDTEKQRRECIPRTEISNDKRLCTD